MTLFQRQNKLIRTPAKGEINSKKNVKLVREQKGISLGLN